MKFPLAFPRPSRADRTWLPAALAALLGLSLMLQLVLPTTVALPEPGVARPLRLPMLTVPPVLTDGLIDQRTLFSPVRRPSADASVSATDPMGGLHPVGVIVQRGVTRLFVQNAAGQVQQLAIGASADGWRLDAVGPQGAQFSRSGERVMVPIGASAARRPAAEPGTESVEEEATP